MINMPDDVGFTEETGHVVDKAEGFDFDALDSLRDIILEAVKRNLPIEPIIKRFVDDELNERVCEVIAKVIAFVIDSQKPRLAARYLAWVSGMAINNGQSASSLASKHRMTKQAFNQGAMRLAKALDLKPTRAMRSLKARAAMKAAYEKRFRQSKAIHP